MIARLIFSPFEPRWRKNLRNYHLENIRDIGRILDVGCAQGGWLAFMRRFGFECHGCEPDPKAAEIAQSMGLSVTCNDLPGAGYPDCYYDVVRFSHVLEHVHHPGKILFEAKRILKPDGLIIIEVPNHAGFRVQVFRQSEDVPRHLYSFSPETLRRYFDKVGLRVLRITTETKHPHTIYGLFGAYALKVLETEDVSEKKNWADQFWSHKNRRRISEYRATGRFFDSIGYGAYVIAVGTK